MPQDNTDLEGATLKKLLSALQQESGLSSESISRILDSYQRAASHIARRAKSYAWDYKPLTYEEIQALYLGITRTGEPILLGADDPAAQVHQVFPAGRLAALLRK